MKHTKIYLCAIVVLFSVNTFAQIKANENMLNAIAGTKKTGDKPPAIRLPWNNTSENLNYFPWKNGVSIPTNNFGGPMGLFEINIYKPIDVGALGYSLMPGETSLTINLHLQNNKKYLVTIHYSCAVKSDCKVTLDYESDKKGDMNTNYTEETVDFSVQPIGGFLKAGMGTFSFVMDPELTSKIPKEVVPLGFPVKAYLMLTVSSAPIKGENRTFFYRGADIKEVD